MRRYGSIAFVIALAASCSGAQQVTPQPASATPDVPHESVKVYSPGPAVTAPELLPLSLASLHTGRCNKFDGRATLSLLVDTTGKPRNIMFIKPQGTDLDKYALRIAAADRFKPGTVDGKPVVVAESLDVKIQSCVVESKDSSGAKTYSLQLRSAPVQQLETLPQPPEQAVLAPEDESWDASASSDQHLLHVGGAVTAPMVLNSVEVQFSQEARAKKISGTCMVSLIVDTQGMPQNVQVTKKLGYGLDEEAVAAVNQYRFKPAMQNGGPVPVKLTVEVNFRFD
jgi:TonB family protein